MCSASGRDVAVVEVQPGGQRVELVDGAPAGRDLARAEAGHAVHLGRVDAVEVDRVRVRGAVDERDPQPLALARAQRRAGDAAVVGPGREADAGRDLDLLVLGDQRPLAQHAAARERGASCPQSKSRRIVCGSKPLAGWSTAPPRNAAWPPSHRSAACGRRAGRPRCASVLPGCVCGIAECSPAAASRRRATPAASSRRRVSRGTTEIVACLNQKFNPACSRGCATGSRRRARAVRAPRLARSPPAPRASGPSSSP